MKELKKSVQYVSDAFDDQKKAIEDMLGEIKQLREENCSLKQRVETLENKLNSSEQKERERNLVVTGIPEQEGEPKNTIQKVMEALKVEINEEDILEVYPVNTKKDSPLIVKLKNTQIKHKIIKGVRMLKGIKVRECGLTGENKNIFFNDDLTKQNQYLFKKTREYKKMKNLSAAYVVNGKIYLKVRDSDSPIRIKSESDLKISA